MSEEVTAGQADTSDYEVYSATSGGPGGRDKESPRRSPARATGSGHVLDVGAVLRANVRNYMMFIALAVIVVIFTLWSNFTFISPYNLTNLINQTAAIGVMTGGMTLIIIIRHIDLSVGFMSGLMGAITGIMLMNLNLPVWLTIPVVLCVGALVGLVIGLLVGKVGIPAFVVTLGAMITSHGLLLYVLRNGGTITITDDFFNALGNGFIPSGGKVAGMTISTLVVGAIGIIAYIWMSLRGRARRHSYNFAVTPAWLFLFQLVLVSAIVGFLAVSLARQNGISWTLVILGVVTAIMVILQTRTRFGRHVYGVGGNPEAAELSGVSVAKVTIIVFVIMQTLVALSGILYASRMKSASPTAGTGFELLVIAGAFIGGCSPAGGIGKVQGSIVGALIMQSLVNGMMLMQVDASVQYIIQGGILVVAVLFDILSRRSAVAPSVSQAKETPTEPTKV